MCKRPVCCQIETEDYAVEGDRGGPRKPVQCSVSVRGSQGLSGVKVGALDNGTLETTDATSASLLYKIQTRYKVQM